MAHFFAQEIHFQRSTAFEKDAEPLRSWGKTESVATSFPWFLTLIALSPGTEGLLLLRQHFITRSIGFLTPLNQYFNSLILPPSPSVSTAPSERIARPFEVPSFMAYLKQHGTPLPFRSTRQRNQFYERWIAGPNF